MATVTPIIRTSKKDSRGRCPIWLRISDRDGTRFLSLGEKVLPSQWNARQGSVRKAHPHADLLNRLIEKKVEQAREEILLLKLEDAYATADHLKEALQPGGRSADFLAFWDRQITEVQKLGKVGRYRRLKATLGKVEDFARKEGLLPLTFDRLTVRFLRDFETYCLTVLKNKQSTVAANLSDLRAQVNRAVEDRLIEHGDNPFLRFTIKQGHRPERAKLSFTEVQALEALDLEEGSLLFLVRDVFLFAFYAAGVRFSDVATMTAGRILQGEEGGADRLVFQAGKTGKRQTVKITPPARRIVERYLTKPDGTEKGADDFVFPLLEGYDLSTPRKLHNAKGSQNALCNKYLRKLGAMAKLKNAEGSQKKLSMHIARHSFADAARSAGWSVYDISKALQHSSIEMTERYLASFDQKGFDARMDELFGNGESSN